ncbi:MAG: hypothetical protein HC785_26515 [Calothrix sp. CSU_2_0]|nr:hypothetical protein [Calothrix sp. CSU_2_0]
MASSWAIILANFYIFDRREESGGLVVRSQKVIFSMVYTLVVSKLLMGLLLILLSCCGVRDRG